MATSARAAPGLGKRARNRAVVEAQILTVARGPPRHPGGRGAQPAAVARDLGMVSSGIYRYVESRDELLTRLIVDSYTSLAQTVAAAHDSVPRRDLAGRWDAIGHGLRAWATRASPRFRPALRLSRARLRSTRRAHR